MNEEMEAVLYPNPATSKVYLRNVNPKNLTKVTSSSIDRKIVYSFTSVDADGIDVRSLGPDL